VRHRERNREDPAVIRAFTLDLRRYLLSRPVTWAKPEIEGGKVKLITKRHTNTESDVLECLHWMGRAAEHEAQLWEPGGRRAQSYKAAQCAGIIAQEISVIHAELMRKMKQDRERA